MHKTRIVAETGRQPEEDLHAHIYLKDESGRVFVSPLGNCCPDLNGVTHGRYERLTEEET